jgi:hypothetical protein
VKRHLVIMKNTLVHPKVFSCFFMNVLPQTFQNLKIEYLVDHLCWWNRFVIDNSVYKYISIVLTSDFDIHNIFGLRDSRLFCWTHCHFVLEDRSLTTCNFPPSSPRSCFKVLSTVLVGILIRLLGYCVKYSGTAIEQQWFIMRTS